MSVDICIPDTILYPKKQYDGTLPDRGKHLTYDVTVRDAIPVTTKITDCKVITPIFQIKPCWKI